MESPKAFANIQNYFAVTTIINRNNNHYKITSTEPFEVEILNLDEINFIWYKASVIRFNPEQDKLFKKNLNLRL